MAIGLGAVAAVILGFGLAGRDGTTPSADPTRTRPSADPFAPQHRASVTAGPETATRSPSPGRAAAGAEIADRTDTDVSPAAESVLRSGDVDGRVLIVLASLAGVGQLAAVDVLDPEAAGSQTPAPVEMGVVDVDVVLDWLDGQPRLRPDHVEVRREDSLAYLVLAYDTPEPPGLFPS
ncbi:MAG: hypothetical protein ACRDWI_06200 [Jiangellaceae bacterium]